MEIQLSNAILYYEKSGSGYPLLLIHGNGEDHTIFDQIIPKLNPFFTVYAIDSRGHGKSSQCLEFDYNELANDFKEFIEKLHLRRPILYGFSDGGIIGIILAYMYPDLLSGMVISGANLSPSGLTDRWLDIFNRMYEEKGDAKIKMILTQPNIDPKQLSNIKIPVLITVGEDDIVKEEHTNLIAQHIKNSRTIVYPGENHISYVVHNQKMADVIIHFAEEQNIL